MVSKTTKAKVSAQRYLQLRAEGLPIYEIAKKLKVSVRTLNLRLEELNLREKKVRVEIDFEEYHRLRDLGWTLTQLAEHFNVSKGHMQKLVRENSRNGKDLLDDELRTTPINPKYVEKLFSDGYDFRQVALILRVREPTLREFIQDTPYLEKLRTELGF